jgi:Tfp pilus assembly protein PilF
LIIEQFYQGDYLKAQETYRHLVKIDSADISSWLKLAEIGNFSQQYDEAHVALQKVLNIDSLNLQGLMLMGEL